MVREKFEFATTPLPFKTDRFKRVGHKDVLVPWALEVDAVDDDVSVFVDVVWLDPVLPVVTVDVWKEDAGVEFSVVVIIVDEVIVGVVEETPVGSVLTQIKCIYQQLSYIRDRDN